MSVKFYVSNLTFLFLRFSTFAAEPKYVKISMDGKDISDSRIGPYNEGQELRLLCESGGGKPIPRVTWYNGSEKISGKKKSYTEVKGYINVRRMIVYNSNKHLRFKVCYN